MCTYTGSYTPTKELYTTHMHTSTQENSMDVQTHMQENLPIQNQSTQSRFWHQISYIIWLRKTIKLFSESDNAMKVWAYQLILSKLWYGTCAAVAVLVGIFHQAH